MNGLQPSRLSTVNSNGGTGVIATVAHANPATVTANDKSVVIPVDVTLRQGQGQVEIQLRIVLDLKVIE